MSNATGRELVIDGKIRAVWSWVHPRFRVEKVTFANADWAKEDYLFRPTRWKPNVRLLPLLGGFIVLPQVRLEGAEVEPGAGRGGAAQLDPRHPARQGEEGLARIASSS